MAAYLLTMLLTLAKLSPDVTPWADAIARACDTPARCVLFTAQALAEGGFSPIVLDGRCNDPAWRSRFRGCRREAGKPAAWCPCDAGLAAGPWQLHEKERGGASLADVLDPDKGAAIAWTWWTRAPGSFTTWKAARATAAYWLRSHPLP